MGPENPREPRGLITDIDGTVNRYERRKAAIWKAVMGTEYEGDIAALDVEEALREMPLLFDIFERLFFSDDRAFTDLDEPLPEAAETLAYLHIGRGLRIAYLTARIIGQNGCMVLGTSEWLGEHKFPTPLTHQDVYLFMREDRSEDPLVYKRREMPRILSLGRPLAGVGDKPQEAIAYTEHGIPSLSFGHPRYRREQYPEDTIFVANWQDVGREVEARLR